MNQYDGAWVKIFHHQFDKGKYFAQSSNAEMSKSNGLFSALHMIGDDYKINGYYEFRLQYPELSFELHWAQKENPLKINGGQLTKGDYFDFDDSSYDERWQGFLSQSTKSTCCLLDGLDGVDWYFALGTVKCSDKFFDKNGYNGFPGPPGNIVKEVILWMRIPANLKSKKCPCHSKMLSVALCLFINLFSYLIFGKSMLSFQNIDDVVFLVIIALLS